MSLNLFGQLVSSQLVRDESKNQPLTKRPKVPKDKTLIGPKSCQSSMANPSAEIQTASCHTALSATVFPLFLN